MEQKDLIPNELRVSGVVLSVLGESAKWARFLAVVGFIMVVFMLLGAWILPAMVAETTYSEFDGALRQSYTATGVRINFIILAVLLFFPCLYLFRFASRMRHAIDHQHQAYFEASFENLKSTLKFYGIVTIVVLAIYAFAFIAVIALALLQFGNPGL